MNWIDLLKVLPQLEDDPDPPLRSGFQLGAPAPQTGRNYFDSLPQPDPRKVARQRSFDSIPQRAANAGRAALDFVPGVGDALAVNDAVQGARKGNWLTAGLAAASLIPAVPNVARAAGGKVPQGERIASAAIRTADGKVHRGTMHADAAEAAGLDPDEGDFWSGFVTESGRFVDEDEARDIALRSKQLRPDDEAHIASGGYLHGANVEDGHIWHSANRASPRSLPMDEASLPPLTDSPSLGALDEDVPDDVLFAPQPPRDYELMAQAKKDFAEGRAKFDGPSGQYVDAGGAPMPWSAIITERFPGPGGALDFTEATRRKHQITPMSDIEERSLINALSAFGMDKKALLDIAAKQRATRQRLATRTKEER